MSVNREVAGQNHSIQNVWRKSSLHESKNTKRRRINKRLKFINQTLGKFQRSTLSEKFSQLVLKEGLSTSAPWGAVEIVRKDGSWETSPRFVDRINSDSVAFQPTNLDELTIHPWLNEPPSLLKKQRFYFSPGRERVRLYFNRWRKVWPVWQYNMHVRDGVERYQKWARMRLVLDIFTQMPAVLNLAGVFKILFNQRNWI